MAEVLDTFERVEDKYCLTRQQMAEFIDAIQPYVKEDVYFQYRCHTIYFDNDVNQLIIQSLNGDDYKMKLRLRAYSNPIADTPIFLETKKKYNDIVYKRRIQLTVDQFNKYMQDKTGLGNDHVSNELAYLIQYYNLKPAVYIGYDRECYVSKTELDTRITFDTNMKYRRSNVSLTEFGYEEEIDDDLVILECKVQDRYPLWLANILTKQRLFKQSFSKYGYIYKRENLVQEELCLAQSLQVH